jgi:hypothetical protein
MSIFLDACCRTSVNYVFLCMRYAEGSAPNTGNVLRICNRLVLDIVPSMQSVFKK